MGRPPCCDKTNVKRGLWTAEEDAKILAYVSNYGIGNWTLAPKRAGLNRCGKSCRLRWTNYLRPDLKHDSFTPQEEELIVDLHKAIGSRWSLIAKRLPGRTDNDVKNYWNTKLSKKLKKMGIDPVTHKPFSQIISDYGNISGLKNKGNNNNVGSYLNNFNPTLVSQQPVLSGALTPVSGKFQDITSSSSCSSAASTSTSVPKFQGQPPPSPSQIAPPFSWSEFLINDPFLFGDSQRKQDDHVQEVRGVNIISSASSSTLTDIGYQTLRGDDYGDSNKKTRFNNNPLDASSSSKGTFVDAILDRDCEIRSQFPELLNGSLDY